MSIYRSLIYILVAALCMVATFPGRTHGLGYITEAVLRDLAIDRTLYGHYNLWATLLGALFCIPVGALIDRFGTRNVLLVTLTCLGLSVIGMSYAQNHYVFFISLLLTRGFGQSALSIASISLISKNFPKKHLGPSMGLYAVLTSLGSMLAFGGIGIVLAQDANWRYVWGAIGVVLIVVYLPMILLCIQKHQPTSEKMEPEDRETEGVSFYKALCTPEFWLFALSISFFGLVSSGIGLFNEDILRERGFSREMYYTLMVFGIPFMLVAKLVIGVLARYVHLNYLLAFSLFLSGTSALLFPWIQTDAQVYAYTIVKTVAGGGLTVLFFIVWADMFGKRDVGRIQGAAQMVTVFASSVGPLFFAYSRQWTDSYSPAFWISGGFTLLFAVWACLLKKRSITDHGTDHGKCVPRLFVSAAAERCTSSACRISLTQGSARCCK